MTVRCELRKWDGFPTYRFEATRLGEDEYGTWLGAPSPTPFVGPKGEGVWLYSFVTLVPADEWWIASFHDEREPKHMELYIDITTRSAWPTADHFTTIDLDLDVVRYRDGHIRLKDSDEFEERRVRLGYPNDVVATARATADRLIEEVTARREPFGRVGADWLARITS